jgi:excisionase family DNA binding protein
MMASTKAVHPNPAEFVTVKTAAEIVKSSEVTIRRKLTTQELRRYKFGGRTLIKLAELLALVKAE